MKKTIYLVAISIITIGCIIFGTIYNTRGFSLKKMRNFFNEGFHNGFSWEFSFDDDDENINRNVIKGYINDNLNEFESININANVMGITIKNGDSFKIESTYNREYLKPEYEVKNGVLHITQNMPKNTNGNNNASTIITIPNRNAMRNIDTKVNVGEVQLNGIEVNNIEVKTNVGRVFIKNTVFNDAELKTNVGEVEVTVDDKLNEYSMDFKTDVGDVSVDGRSYKRSYSSSGSTKKRIEAKTNVGAIVVR